MTDSQTLLMAWLDGQRLERKRVGGCDEKIRNRLMDGPLTTGTY
jgi:hypothetical protein